MTLTRLPLDVAPPDELPPIPRPLKLFGFFASPLDLQDHERLNAEREQEILLEAINDQTRKGESLLKLKTKRSWKSSNTAYKTATTFCISLATASARAMAADCCWKTRTGRSCPPPLPT